MNLLITSSKSVNVTIGRIGPKISISNNLQSKGGFIKIVGDKYFGFYADIFPSINTFVSLPFLASSNNLSKYFG